MSGAIPVLVQYAFMAWTGTNLPFQRRYPICAVNTYTSVAKILTYVTVRCNTVTAALHSEGRIIPYPGGGGGGIHGS